MTPFKPRGRPVIDHVTDRVTTSGAVGVGVPIGDTPTTYHVPPTADEVDRPRKQSTTSKRHHARQQTRQNNGNE